MISVDRTLGQRLGLRVDKEDGEVFILEVQPGLVQEWNEANPDCQVGQPVGSCRLAAITLEASIFQGERTSKLSKKIIEKGAGFILVSTGFIMIYVIKFKHDTLSVINFPCRSGLEMSFSQSTAKVATHGH